MSKHNVYECDWQGCAGRREIDPYLDQDYGVPHGWFGVEHSGNTYLAGQFCSPECLVGHYEVWMRERDEEKARLVARAASGVSHA